MFNPSTFSQHLSLFIKGTLMGVANKVPGVSGGAVAYILGFYNELIHSFQKFNGKALQLLFSGKLKSLYQYVNGSFLLAVLGGVVFSYFTISKLLDYFLKTAELYVWSLFFGMIIGSVIYLCKKHRLWNTKTYQYLTIGLLVGVAISFIPPLQQNTNLWFVFVCGIVGVSGMTIPGLSGSYILMLLGNYILLLVDAVNVLNDVLWASLQGDYSLWYSDEHQSYLKIMLVFTFGSIFGLISLSQLLSFLLDRWENRINALIIGFIIGSLGTVWPWKHKIYKTESGDFVYNHLGNNIAVNYERYFPDFLELNNFIALGIIATGVLLVLSIERFSKKELNT